MNTLEIILGIILLLIAVALIVVITLQQSKKGGLGGAIGGGTTDSYYGRNKSKSKEAMLKKLTVIFSVALAVLALVLYSYHGSESGHCYR